MAIDFASGYILKNQTLIANYPFTMACWIYPDVVNIEQAPLALIDKDSVNSYFCDLHVYPNGTCGLRAFNGSVYEETTPAGAISASTWTHLCGVYTSATSRSAYKNGGTKTTTTTSVTLGNLDRVLTGAMQFQGQSILQPYNGKTAEVAVWDVALSDAEVTILALGVSPRLVRPASLKFYFPLVRDIVDYRDSTSPTTLNTSVFDHPRVIYSRGGFSPGVPSSITSYTLTADSAAYTVSGTAASLERSLKLVAASASYAITGTAASLKIARKIVADAAAYTCTGSPATLRITRRIDAASGAVACTGTTASITIARMLPAAAGSFAVTGTAAAVKIARRIAADSGSFAWTGFDAGFSSSNNKTIIAENGSFVCTGTNAALRIARKVSAQSGAYIANSTDASLKMARRIACDSGGFLATGQPAALVLAKYLAAASGAFVASGTDANLRFARRIVAGVGAFVLTGQPASVIYSGGRVIRRVVFESQAVQRPTCESESCAVASITGESVL